MLTRLRLSIHSLKIDDPRFDKLDTDIVLVLAVKVGPIEPYRFIDFFKSFRQSTIELPAHELSFELDLEKQDFELPLRFVLSGWDPDQKEEVTIDRAEALLLVGEQIQPEWAERRVALKIETRWIPYQEDAQEDASEKVLPINVAEVSTFSSLKPPKPSELKILARVPSSKPLTVRRGPMRLANEWHDLYFASALTSKSIDHFDPADFEPPKALVLVSSPDSRIELTVTSEGDLGPIDWHVVRCKDDSPAAKKAGTEPKVERRGATWGSLLLNDACGSFYVAALRRNSSIAAVLPLVLVSCTVSEWTATGGEQAPSAGFSKSGKKDDVDPDRVRLSTGDKEHPAVAFSARVLLLGGGKDGKRGVDRVYLGWANNLVSEAFECFYGMNVWMRQEIGFTLGQPPYPFRETTRQEKERDWIVIKGPVLDTSRGYSPFRQDPPHSRHGGLNVTLGSARSTVLPEDSGALLQILAEDIPNKEVPVRHPFAPKLLIEEIHWKLQMKAALLVWTDTQPGAKGPPVGQPGRVGFRTFHALAIVDWGMEGRWLIDPPKEANGRFVLESSKGTPPEHDQIRQQVLDRPMPPEAVEFEVRPPTVLENIILDYFSGWTQEAEKAFPL